MTTSAPTAVPHFIRGELRDPRASAAVEHDGFTTPALELDELVWPRTQPGPAFDVPLAEIIDFLAAVGERMDLETNPHLQHALEASAAFSALGPRILAQGYRGLRQAFDPDKLWFQVDHEVGRDVLDGWKEVPDLTGQVRRIRAFPPRLVHIMAGNAPGVTAASIVRGALTKGVHLLKLPSNDLFTGTALLRTMAEVGPNHPVTQSFSCVYWRGGDPEVESALFRAQYFDRLVAWGGDAAIRSALQYVAPGFDLVSFDPKVSISLLGREALASEEAMRTSAAAAAYDASLFNQEVCAASRFVYAEGDRDDLVRWCELLVSELGVERDLADAVVPTLLPADARAEVEVLRSMSPAYDVFGATDGTGLVILSEDPVGFHPSAKTVNVVQVSSLHDALQYVNVATQTVGIFPPARGAELRDSLAAHGMQRLVPLGQVLNVAPGYPHDGFFALHRFVKWLVDEC
ncbi:acyl-CoA reductase [Mycobacterium conspicuum]|uniref:Long-chain-fatty-acyl-CoA reductase n=1 Tax=Mycobacterium conspicuum TaxID=44010 RepID=A0A1X1TMU1_9MYCO|nr:acyl-CoA reductase [Mycobacterium conspicuum]ORV45905.1 long-chain-fatty-acyl-CoA reductase [Mycobacterium conspicuum]BBZ38836.1 long-chain-fatty-acyl-CoA reductase [Mycobacterium conspicuum]